MRLFDLRMNDGSRHFGDLPERYDPVVPEWDVLRDAVGEIAGAELTGFVTDQVTEAWIDFTWRGHRFSINNQHGQWWFFVADPSCPDDLLLAVLDRFDDRVAPLAIEAPDGYEVARAHDRDLPLLPAIEDAAAAVFPDGDLPDDDRDQGLTPEQLADAHALGRLWVARSQGAPVGFALALVVDGHAHLHEMDVSPEHARRGVGRALLQHVIAWARRAELRAITLLTFRDLPFNGPFYRSAGFVELAEHELGPELSAMRHTEVDKGLDVARRVAMRLDLGASR